MNTLLPLISSIVALLFAITVLDQFFARRKPYQLVWAIGLFMYCISTLMEFLTGIRGMNEVVYRLWYLFGAILVASYLGMGTVYLIAPRRTAHIVLGILVLASVFIIVRVFTVNIDLSNVLTLSGSVMPADIRRITPVFNVFGTVALIGGAIYSAWIFRRHHIMPYRVVSNILVAVGAMLPALGGTILRGGGPVTVFYLLEMVGIFVIFLGFLRSREVFGVLRFPFIHGFSRVGAD